MLVTVLDVLVVLSWAVVPVAVVVMALLRLRRSGSRAVGAGSLALLVVAFGSIAVVLAPTVSATLERTFAGHMAQHLVLGLLAPLFLVIGRTPELLPWALPVSARRDLRRGAGVLLRPPRSVAAPTVAMIVTWYAWHVPALYGAAADQGVIHVLEHATFLGVGTWFWAAVAPHRRRLGASVAALFVTTVAMGLLGATLALSPEAFYAPHVSSTSAAGRLDDQHLGGMLMWTPGGLVYLCAAVVQLVRWLDPGESGDHGPPAGAVPVGEVAT